ncbi:MAG: hypothetical protein KDE15_13215 [Erythrobacter sp.]|nr:hypothetical protein [Erythrobacter sp.]
MTSPLALSPGAAIAVSHFGNEAQPLVCVDQALADVQLVRTIAARHSFQPIGPFYPGLRAVVSEQIAMPLVQPLLPALQQAFALEREPAYFECYLSLVTRAPADLDPIQRLPHFDGVERERIAVLLYLSHDPQGGTAFYRQHGTGFESVDATRFEQYRAELDAATRASGLPPARYIGDDSPLFERVLKVDGQLNRMVAYHGNSLHCAALPEDFVPVADPMQGRLTLNLFLRA